MKIRLDTSFKRVNVSFLADPGTVIDVPDKIAEQLMRGNEKWVPAHREAVARGKSPEEQVAEEEQAAAEAEEAEKAQAEALAAEEAEPDDEPGSSESDVADPSDSDETSEPQKGLATPKGGRRSRNKAASNPEAVDG